MERTASAKVAACRGIGEHTCTKYVPNHFKIMASGFLFFTPKGQKRNSHLIHLSRFCWLALHFYTFSKMAKNTFFWDFLPRSSRKLESILYFRIRILRGKTYRNQLLFFKCQNLF